MPKDRKSYFRWYNIHVRGTPEKAETFLRLKCLICGNLAYPSAIKRSYDTYAKYQRGFTDYMELGDPRLANMQGFISNDTREKYSWMAHKCATQLRRFVAMGLITAQEVQDILGFQVVNTAHPINEAVSQFSDHVPSGGGVLMASVPTYAHINSSKKVKQLESVNYGEKTMHQAK